MKICAAQTRPIPGDVRGNIAHHHELIALAAARGAGVIIFPELSLTGYEPRLAGQLAVGADDLRLQSFQESSDARGIRIGVGIPTRTAAGVCISMVLFEPFTARRVYSKNYLHADEEPFFVPGHDFPHWRIHGIDFALAICYEISVPEHWETARRSRPQVYFASVAKTAKGAGLACERLAALAKEQSLIVLMANGVGPADGGECGGRTSIWNRAGDLAGQLDDAHEGLLMIDTETQQISRIEPVSIESEDAAGPLAQQLIEAMCAELSARYGTPPSPFSVADVSAPRTVFLVARLGGELAGCGALRRLDDMTAEVKRMYVAPVGRRRGLARRLLAGLENAAREFGYQAIRLETGVQQPEAMGLYESSGYQRIAAFGPYVGNPVSVCYEKRLGA